VPGAFDVLGAALASDTVTVNSASVYRHGEYYRKELTVANTSAAVWQSVAVAATGETTVNGNVFVPKTQEQFTYDLDGNLLTDGRWTYTWDAENRLMGMVALSTVPTSAKLKLDFTYDWKSRRIQKTVSTWNGSSYGSPVSTRFLYDGWNLIAALNSSSSVLQSFLWGSDLSGSPQRAGGVGGLLVANDSVNGVHFATFDGNGNVVALVKGSDGTLSARYEYGVFGEALRTTGLMAKPNPFRWSTRFQDDETDFVMYPRRPYTTSAGRWLGRDAKGEGVAPNLYAFLANCPLDSSDPLGLAPLWYTLQVDPTESDDPSHVGFYPNAILLPVIYPKNGGKCACRGQLLGVAAGAAWIDLSTSLGLKDVQPAYYNNVVSPWPYWNPAYKRIFENPRYVGAGFTAVLRQPAIGVACCKNPVWYNYIVHSWWPDTSDGRFPGNQFVDSPGGLRPPARSFSSSYKLVLKCEDPGWPAEEVGRWYWGVDIQLGTWQWTGTFYPPTSDVVTSWPF